MLIGGERGGNPEDPLAGAQRPAERAPETGDPDARICGPKVFQLHGTRRPRPRLLAEFSTEPVPGGESAEGLRWTRLRIFELRAGQYRCEKIRGPAPLDLRTATVSSFAQAHSFFGGGWVVKELFAMLDPQQFPRWPRR